MPRAVDHIEQIVPNKPMLTSEEVAACSGMTVHTLAVKRLYKHPPDFVRFNNRTVRYPRPAVVEWLREKHVKTAGAA